MKFRQYAICMCGLWCYAPDNFQEDKHFIRCTCGKNMFLHHSGKPSDGGYTASQETVGSLVSQRNK